MFNQAISFNQDINCWDVSGVNDICGMFAGANSLRPLPIWWLTYW